MTYEQIITLNAVVQYGSFKAASEMLHKTQPSVSVSIKKLEEEFSVQIFSREEYRPKLTSEGHLFYEKAKLALHHMQNLQNFGEELGLGIESEVLLSIEGLFPIEQLYPKLHEFFAQNPSTNLKLSTDYVSGTWEKLLNKEIDLGITPLHKAHEDIHVEKIYCMQMVPVCTKDFLNEHKKTVDALKALPHIIVSDSGSSSHSFGLIEGGKRWTVSDFYTKKSIICAGLGWGRLPSYLADEELKNKSIIPLPVTGIESHSVNVYLAHNTKRPMGPVTKKLWQNLRDQF